MNSFRSSRGAGAFTLVEMLCVIAVVAILAALLLPVLSQGQSRAKRLQCVNNLKETGIAFQIFAHDHQARFPMQLAMSEGGSLEFVQNGYRVNGEFYFSFRHFAPLSNMLTTPKTLYCPAETTRLPALDFTSFRNENLSYFVGVSCRYDRPNAILAGDRNITNDVSPYATIVRNRYGRPLEWTGELHRFKGNLLFADGHVEELNGAGLEQAAGYAGLTGDLFLPSVQPETVMVVSSGSSPAGVAVSPKKPDTNMAAASASGTGPIRTYPPVVVPTQPGTVPGTESAPQGSRSPAPSNSVSTASPGVSPTTTNEPFLPGIIENLGDLTRSFAWLLCLLVLFVLVGLIAASLRRRPYSRRRWTGGGNFPP